MFQQGRVAVIADVSWDISEALKMFQVHVVLPSGLHECLSIPGSSKVRDLRIAAQQAFGQKLLRLATANHQILANPNESLEAAGLQDKECLTAVVLQPQLAATPRTFAFWCPGPDKILTWGYPTYSGNSSTVQAKLRSVQQIQATEGAFAAILADGSVVTWGLPQFGGDSSGVQAKLRGVQQIQAIELALWSSDFLLYLRFCAWPPCRWAVGGWSSPCPWCFSLFVYASWHCGVVWWDFPWLCCLCWP